MKKQNLSEFLKEKRIQAGYSQLEIAEKFGYSTSQFISNWERGLSQPPTETLKKLTKLYNVPLDQMFQITLQTAINELTIDLKRKFYGKRKGA